MILEGVDRYRVMEAIFEGVRVIMTYRGEPYSPAYIQGLSGAAFRIAGICPCAPTCSAATSPQNLVHLLGYEATAIPLDEQGNLSDAERQARLQTLLEQVKAELRAGRPAMLWHAFTAAEWDVVCGYDEETQAFYGRGSYAGQDSYAREPQTRTLTCLDICPALGAILIGEKTGTLDARKAEVAALRGAVRHARSLHDIPDPSKWTFLEGLQCYDRWVNNYLHDPTRTRGIGDSYCLSIYRSTHRAAGEFLCELAVKYLQASRLFESAAFEFASEANVLDQCVPFLGWDSPSGPDELRNARAGALLAQARDHYAAAIDGIEKALADIE